MGERNGKEHFASSLQWCTDKGARGAAHVGVKNYSVVGTRGRWQFGQRRRSHGADGAVGQRPGGVR
jgi:hypothetical protein